MRFRPVVVFLGAAALTASAFGQTKISGELQCKAEPPAPVAIPDKPNHAYAVVTATCTWSKPFDMGGSPAKDGKETISSEIWGDKASDRGYFAGTMASGDTYTVKFAGTSRSKDGKPVGNEGTWSFTGGTGKLKGLKGGGKYKSTAGADGTVTSQIDGEYSLP